MNEIVSIITPTYNRAYILGKAIESVLAQTYKNWELIIVDDGSTDGTKKLVESYRNSRIKYHYQDHKDQTIARNLAFELAKGDWIGYLDSDNELYPQYLEVMLCEIAKNPDTIWSFPRVKTLVELWENGKMTKQKDVTDEQFPNSISLADIVNRKIHTDMTGFMHSREIIDAGIRFDPKVPKMED